MNTRKYIMQYRYILEPYSGMSSRHICPSCQKRERTFVRYIDTVTGEYIHESVGRCNRESRCAYHYNPKEYFHDNKIETGNSFTPQGKFLKKLWSEYQASKVSFIDIGVFEKSLQIGKDIVEVSELNYFIKYLLSLFGETKTRELISTYFIGTSKHWKGATVFWQIDKNENIRTGKIMLYNPIDGKRVKHPFNHNTWVHSVMGIPDFSMKQCFFGEHLLSKNNNTVAIVESEKTAIIASVYLPEFTWIATGGIQGLNPEKCMVLRGRKVILYPDLGAYDTWVSKVKVLSSILNINVSNYLETCATEEERYEGFDLADYLIQSKFN